VFTSFVWLIEDEEDAEPVLLLLAAEKAEDEPLPKPIVVAGCANNEELEEVDALFA
jgi:hypothetical protein